MAVNRINTEGIDYDAFREMKLEREQIANLKNTVKKQELSKQETTDLKKDKIDDLVLSMMANNFGKKGNKKISNHNLNQLFQLLHNNVSYMELKNYYTAILTDLVCFPISNVRGEENRYTFGDTWNSYRGYGGNRRHEGTDIFPEENIRGQYPIVSMTNGIVEKMGWLEQGGYRIGIRGNSGAYFYYAHLDSYAEDIAIGDTVKAGQFLGYMGDSGYGEEGTKGKFDVHLHLGIYVETPFGELSVNPYTILYYLKNR